MRIGTLNRRLDVQAATATRTALGGSVPTWETVATVWARVLPLAGRESQRVGNAIIATATHEVRLRYKAFPDLTMRHRFKFGTRVFRIESMDQVTGWAEEWRCQCSETA
jgi:SPP1 family predicted phage head-tail adaptor